ncbi:hypothetical protein CDD82_4692 [Ophiocordyceps australis]|uniref:RING-CH-type domain-containing protein n=1 Tax=Ophiocordyceps australis TaxID=1399860 RepID=A0A2C5ZSL7_9HYPO|nr:hypothetical protein CDD82_4692 [Ophiocordyceps australis]
MEPQPTWNWAAASGLDAGLDASSSRNRHESSRQQRDQQPDHQSQQNEPPLTPHDEPQPPQPPRRHGPRTCRICLETEQPRYPTGFASTFGMSPSSRQPTYVSDDPELGRLLSPCRCKGSQKYVHEGCLTSWRMANPMATTNYWQCPTCKFSYRLVRMQWASMLSSKWAQVALTLTAMVLGIFLLGFVADPILDLWFDPVGTISDTVANVVSDIEAQRPPPHQEPTTWTEHFTKGFFSLGFVGFIKSVVAMGPWQWLNLRNSGLLGSGRRRGTGRARMDNFNILFVLIGTFTFLMAIWKLVNAVSARVLKIVSDKVFDVGADDDDDEDDGDDTNGQTNG